MKKINLLSAVLSLFLLVPASITWAQNISSQKGLTTTVFNLESGIIKIYLPDDIRPGDVISGSIVTEPSGKNAKQVANNLAELKHYFISLNDIKFPVDNAGKPFKITIPPGKPLPCRVGLTNNAGIKILEITVPSLPEKTLQATTSECHIPSHALTGAPLKITGPFDGNASNTSCNLDNKPIQILAESPRQCIVLFPAATIGGMQTFASQENGKPSCSKKITAVDMDINVGKMNLSKGEKTNIDVKITGLQNLPDTAKLTVTNSSTSVIAMTNGNNITVSIPPSADNIQGSYTQRFTVQSIKAGNFTVNVNLDLPETASANKTTLQPGPLYNMQAWLPLKNGDLTANYDGQTDEAKVKGGENVYVIDNAIWIFLNGIFLQSYDVANTGTSTVQNILTEYSNPDYAEPGIDCDSITRICKKNLALNVFWGDVYSVFEGKMESKLVKGATVEKASQNSLLITRGWEIDCCSGEFKLKLFFQSMSGTGGTGSHNVSFTKILKTGKPCPINCSDCKKKCEEEKSRMEKAMEEARKRMEEIKRNENGNN